MTVWAADSALAPGVRRRRPGWPLAAAWMAVRRAVQRAVAGLGGGCWLAGQRPGAVPAGQPVPQQGVQVDRGAPGQIFTSFLPAVAPGKLAAIWR